ncbi:MAG: hypothetical protein M3O65_10135 [Actinomycetota bacterium]|nr:hypothetical protein [Actinomycetota bacterium]
MSNMERIKRVPVFAAIVALTAFGVIGTAYAALQGNQDAKKPKVLIGADNDNPGDPTIQPPGVVANQSLSAGDQLFGGSAADMIVGRLGSDVITAGAGDDVMIGGTEGGSTLGFPNSDVAYGGTGSDAFIWAPGDGSDAFVGGNAAKVKKVKVKASAPGKKGKKKVKPVAEVDTLVIGNLVLTNDNSTPQLFQTKFGQLPKVFSSDRGVPTPLGGGTPTRTPNLVASCQILAAPAGLGYEYLVRFFGGTPPAPGNQAVTIRVKGVEQVICPTVGTDGATLTTLGKTGSGPLQTKTVDFRAAAKSKLAAFVF